MKVLLCIDNLGSGGAQRQMAALAVGLKNQGFDVHFFVYYPQDFFKHQLLENGIKIIVAEKKDRIGLGVLFKLRKLLVKEKYDLAISYLITPNIYLSLAGWLSQTRTRIITSERAKSNIQSNAFFKLRYWCHKRAYAVVFNSVHEQNNWTSHFKELKTNSITIYNGVDHELFSPSNKQHKRDRTIIGVGTIGPHKNIRTLIKAVKILKDIGEAVQVHWYGKFIDSSAFYSDYHKEMQALVKDLDIEDLWQWHKPEKSINEIIIRYDCMVLPSVSEGLPNVVCESLSCGVPVIVSNILDHPLLVEENKRGYLFNPDDPRELAEKIRTMYALGDSAYTSMQSNARHFAEDELNMDRFIKKYILLLNSKNQGSLPGDFA